MNNAPILAGRFRRLLATLIDAVLVPALTLALVMISGVVEDAEDYSGDGWQLRMLISVFALAVLSYLILNGYGLWRRGQTLGKQLLGIAIVQAPRQADGHYVQRPTPFWKLICIRAMFFPLLFMVVPAIVDHLFALTRSRRCLHDLAAGTIVVRQSRA